jgi:hypothetical protein
MKALYVNHGLGTQCGVYDFGKRQFEHLRKSTLLTATYAECNSAEEFRARYEEASPDVVFFNYMPIVMPWISKEAVSRCKAKKVVVQHLFDPTTISLIMDSYSGIFDYMICNDPTIETQDKRIFVVSRTIGCATDSSTLDDNEEIRIGSFGFGLPHKNFHLIMRQINESFDKAVFNLHMTVGTFTGDYTEPILDSIRAEITKPNIRLSHTNDYVSEQEIINRLSHNHINALLYELPPSNAGISSSADYLIASGKPMLLSNCALFRHIDADIPRYPNSNFREIMDSYEHNRNKVIDVRSRWSNAFVSDIEKMLQEIL